MDARNELLYQEVRDLPAEKAHRLLAYLMGCERDNKRFHDNLERGLDIICGIVPACPNRVAPKEG